jgi:hypothetical protein
MTVNGLVASSFLDFLSFFAMILFPPFFCLPVWANAAYYARCGPRFPAKKQLCYVVGNSRDAQNRPDIEAVPRAVCVDLINLTMNYSTFWASDLVALQRSGRGGSSLWTRSELAMPHRERACASSGEVIINPSRIAKMASYLPNTLDPASWR